MSRGNGRMRIFTDQWDYRQFLYILGDLIEQGAIQCWNYCVMPNHYHVTVQPTTANLSATFRQLNAQYAQWWNKRHHRVGHVFQGRFKDQVVQREGHLMSLTRYVVMNPVRARLVDRPDKWLWSSYRATAGLEVPQPFLAASSTLALFGEDDERVLQGRFTKYVTVDREEDTVIERIRSNERVIGTRAFKVLVEASSRPLDVPSPPGDDPPSLASL